MDLQEVPLELGAWTTGGPPHPEGQLGRGELVREDQDLPGPLRRSALCARCPARTVRVPSTGVGIVTQLVAPADSGLGQAATRDRYRSHDIAVYPPQ